MKHFFVLISGWLGINVLIGVVAIFFFVKGTPVDVRMRVESAGEVTVNIGSKDFNSTGKYFKSLRQPLPFQPKDLFREYFVADDLLDLPAIEFRSTSGDALIVRDVSIVRLGVFVSQLKLGSAVRAYQDPLRSLAILSDGAVRVKLKNGHCCLNGRTGERLIWSHKVIISKTSWILFALSEVVIVLLVVLTRHFVSAAPFYAVSNSVCVSFLVAYASGFIIPLQLYLGNKSDFDFTCMDVLFSQVLCVILIAIIFFVLLHLLQISMAYLPHAIILAFIVYEYILCMLLSMGEPPLTGDLSYYSNVRKSIVDLSVLGLLLLLSLCGYKWIKRYVKVIAACIVILLSASLLDVRRDVRTGQEQFRSSSLRAGGFCSKLSVANAVMWSPRQNVLVFVLDSCSTDVAHHILSEIEMAQLYPGFIVFDDSLGMHNTTGLSTVSMMTGEYYYGSTDKKCIEEYLGKVYSQNSVLAKYANAGWSVYFLPSAHKCGYAWPRANFDVSKDEAKELAFWQRKEGGLQFTLFELARLRMTPFCAKSRMLALTYAEMPGHGRVDTESSLYPILHDARKENMTPVFAFMHTEGGHVPYDTDQNGRRLLTPGSGYSSYLNKSHFAMSQLGQLFSKLRSIGVYDSAQIIVLGDHGSLSAGERHPLFSYLDDFPLKATPMLMVKPSFGKGNPIFVTDAPVSFSKMPELLLKMSKDRLSRDEIRSILLTNERKYIEPTIDGYHEWIVLGGGDAAKVVDREIKFGRDQK